MMKMLVVIITIFSSLGFSILLHAEPILKSVPTNKPPQLDGQASDDAWKKAPTLTTHDPIANIDIHIQSVYDDNSIYMLVTFADDTENKQHKLMHWNDEKGRYLTGKEREDTFIFKWNMLPNPADISLSSDTSYEADIWYWKSARTDHAGHADDKHQTYQLRKTKNSKLLISKEGQYFYLSRKGDSGQSAYSPIFYTEKESETVEKYNFQQPEESRADVMAKGIWKEGIWTIEFQRALNTGHADDLQLNPLTSYYFGVSRYEIAGRKSKAELFGAGEITELIKLNFIKK